MQVTACSRGDASHGLFVCDVTVPPGACGAKDAGVHTNAVMQLNRVGLPRQWLLQIKKLLGGCQGIGGGGGDDDDDDVGGAAVLPPKKRQKSARARRQELQQVLVLRGAQGRLGAAGVARL